MLPTNTHILFPEFEYHTPNTVSEAAELLAEHGANARILAGGTDLLVQMKMERRHPEHLISLQRIIALHDITQNGSITIGAATSIRSLYHYLTPNSDALYRTNTPTSNIQHPISTSRSLANLQSPVSRLLSLSSACNSFSTVQIMYMATIGGNLCNASPAADTAPVLLSFDARVTLKGKTTERTVPLSEFFLAPGKTILNPDELLTHIHIPLPAPNTGSAFQKISRVVADISQVCAAVTILREGNRVQDARIALGSVAPTPFRALQAQAALIGETFTPALAEHAGKLAASEIKPITDVRASADYRQQVASVIVRDALLKAWDNC